MMRNTRKPLKTRPRPMQPIQDSRKKAMLLKKIVSKERPITVNKLFHLTEQLNDQ